jgi:hypothetical protein
MRSSPDKFYKKGSQEKTVPHRPELFLLLRLDRASSVLTDRAMCSVAAPCDPVVWVSLPPSSFSPAHKDAQFIAKVRELGASGYVNKLAAKTELVRAIQTTASGEEVFLE